MKNIIVSCLANRNRYWYRKTFITCFSQLKIDIRSCRCKNFRHKQVSGLIGGSCVSSAKKGGAGGEREKRESREKGKGRLLQESVFTVLRPPFSELIR